MGLWALGGGAVRGEVAEEGPLPAPPVHVWEVKAGLQKGPAVLGHFPAPAHTFLGGLVHCSPNSWGLAAGSGHAAGVRPLPCSAQHRMSTPFLQPPAPLATGSQFPGKGKEASDSTSLRSHKPESGRARIHPGGLHPRPSAPTTAPHGSFPITH